MKKFFSFLSGMLVIIFAVAQAPNQFNYQGVARNSVGNVLPNQNIALRLTVHDGTAGGTVVYRETRNVTTNYFGLFNVAIGSAGATGVTGTIATVAWGSGAKFLQVEMDPAGGTTFADMGTAQLLSVPYALNAGGSSPTGTAGGDLSGAFPNPTIIIPLIKTQAVAANSLINLTNSSATGTAGAVQGTSASADASASAILGTISSVTPGGFSAAVKGVNNGTGGLGIGVWGTQAGSGWGVYGSTPGGIGVNGSSVSGIGVWGSSSTGRSAQFENTNAVNASNTVFIGNNGTADALSVTTTGTASRAGFFVMNNPASTADAVAATTNGTGPSWAFRGTSTGTNGAALFIVNNPTSVANNVQSNHNGLGRAGLFQTTNVANTADAVRVNQNGIGVGLNAIINNGGNNESAVRGETNGNGNAINGISTGGGIGGNFQAGFGRGVLAISTSNVGAEGQTSTISSAGIIGRNLSGGEAIVGFTTANGAAAGAVVGRNDGNYAGVHGFSTHADGIGVVARVTSAVANNSVALLATNNQPGGGGNIAIFQNSGTNVARIDRTGLGFFNNGTQVGGADVAETFEVEGEKKEYEFGDVLIISTRSDRKVEKSSAPYSTLVAGVYATKPGVILTDRNAEENKMDDLVNLGVIGVIPTKVSMEGGAIKRGDLLVTSSTPGVAMKADPDKVKVGQVLGKALQDYNAEGVGKINVLVSVK